MVAILGYSRAQINAAIGAMYSAVARDPRGDYHFPVGEAAGRALGYPQPLLEQLPRETLDSFVGVGYPFRGEAVAPGDTTLDLGAGAGNDTLIAAGLTGPDGQVVALDLTAAMTRKLEPWARASRTPVAVVQGSAEQLPLADACIDSVTSNGVINLIPDKRRALAELARVLKPGGRLQLADVVINRPVDVDCSDDPRLWVECVVGATVAEDLLEYLADAGFEAIRILHRRDYFALSPSAQTRDVAAGFGAHAVELSARRADRSPGAVRRWCRRLRPKRWLRAIGRRGFFGITGLLLAVLACYGTLAVGGVLALLGGSLSVSGGLWAGAIAAFALLSALGTAAGWRKHRRPGPALTASAGLALVSYALFIDYHFWLELSGFVLLALAAFADLRARRRRDRRILGLNRA